MNEGVELIIMNAVTATMRMDVCVFMVEGVVAAWQRGSPSVAFFAAKRTSTGNMVKSAL